MEFTPVPAPKYAGMRTFDCNRCGRTEVKPVFLSSTAGIAAYGSGCAARLMGITVTRVRNLVENATIRADREAAAVAERREGRRQALAAFHAGDDEDPYLITARQTFARTGGFDAHGGFSAWLAAEAA